MGRVDSPEPVHPVSGFGFAPNSLSPGEGRRILAGTRKPPVIACGRVEARQGDAPAAKRRSKWETSPPFKEDRITRRNRKGGSGWRAQAASSLPGLENSAAMPSGGLRAPAKFRRPPGLERGGWMGTGAAWVWVNPPRPRCHQRGHIASHEVGRGEMLIPHMRRSFRARTGMNPAHRPAARA